MRSSLPTPEPIHFNLNCPAALASASLASSMSCSRIGVSGRTKIGDGEKPADARADNRDCFLVPHSIALFLLSNPDRCIVLALPEHQAVLDRAQIECSTTPISDSTTRVAKTPAISKA